MNNYLIVLITFNFCIAIYCHIVFMLYEVNMSRIRKQYEIKKVMSKSKSLFKTVLYFIVNFIPVYNLFNAISFTASLIVSLYDPSGSDDRIKKFYKNISLEELRKEINEKEKHRKFYDGIKELRELQEKNKINIPKQAEGEEI